MTDINSIIDRIKAGETGRDIGAAALYAAGSTELAGGPAFFDRETGDAHFFDAEQMLTSMDACLALMERALPGWMLFDLGEQEGRKKPFHASISRRGQNAPIVLSYGSTLCAALLIAILKAVKAESEAA